ncbi:MAG TPA: MMPL family transporter [Solirubrobacterales bacterium]|nr:MMPL family transporter [Solirubrobacterales bacterium]
MRLSDQAPRPGLETRLDSIAKLATRHPRKVLLVWALAIGLLALRGVGLEDDLSTHPAYIEGTAAARAHAIVAGQFGGEDSVIVMLHGPAGAVDRQGDALAHRLDALPSTLVVSPWTAGGSIDGLQPRPGVAGMLVSAEHPGRRQGTIAPIVRREASRFVSAPVHASLAGSPVIVDSLRGSFEAAASVGEKLAIPVLLIVLLFVCRSLLGAAMPVLVGGAVVAASRGAMAFLHDFFSLDPLAVGVAAMLGLALGVDYSLLVVSRFRQEQRQGGDPAEVVRRTVIATGHSVVPAGLGLLVAMVVAAQILPSMVSSIALAAGSVAVLSVISALFAVPAVLMVAGRYLDRWSLPPRAEEGGAVMRWSRRVSSRMPLVLGILFAMVFLAGWAITLDTNTGSAAQLPPGDSGRKQQEAIEHLLGPGWVGPLEVVVNGRDEPVTTKARLQALASFQRRVEADPGVASMAGFRSLEESTEELGGVEAKLVRQEDGLDRLGRSIARAEGGAAASSDGFASAAEGASALATAAGATEDGSRRLAAGLRGSRDGSARLSDGLENASDGSENVAEGASRASRGAGKLASKVDKAKEESGESTHAAEVLKGTLEAGEEDLVEAEGPLGESEQHLDAAWRALQAMTVGQEDPEYRASLDAVEAAIRNLTGAEPGVEEAGSGGVATKLGRGREQVETGIFLAGEIERQGEANEDDVAKLARSTAKLENGLRKLKEGSRELSGGVGRLAGGGDELTPGLAKLAAGAERLAGGVAQLEDGAGRLAGGLGSGARRSRLLAGGLRQIHGGVVHQQDDSRSGLEGARENSPGLFKSGYFYLAGFDGVRPRQRSKVGLLLNLDRGGTAARMIVIPSDGPVTADAAATAGRVREAAARLERETGAEVVVGGLGPELGDINTALRDSGPWARLALSLVTIAILLFVTRSLALALIASVLNLLTVGTTFGLLALLFDGSLLGGPGFVDTSVIAAAVTLVFGLAIDYEVFVFARIREEYLRTGSTTEAIDLGLARTAHVITGAALIMCAVFVAFSVSELATLRNLGVCLAISTVIDALLIRFVLVPAAMRALGDRSWWLPRWLDRLLPGPPRPLPAARGASA